MVGYDSNDVGYEHLDDAKIVQLVLVKSEDDNTQSDDKEECEAPVTHKSAMEMLNSYMIWLQMQPESTAYNISVLISLREISNKKNFLSEASYHNFLFE